MDREIDRHVSHRVREIRIAKGVDPHIAAKWLGLDAGEYAEREAGEIGFNLLELIELSWKLNVPTSTFTGGMPKARPTERQSTGTRAAAVNVMTLRA